MKKILTTALVLGLLSGISGLSANAVAQGENKDRGYIAVNTSSEAEMSPDVAEISFSVKTTDTKSMQKATASNKEISEKVYSELKALINPATGDYIKTSNFNASPVYSYNGSKRTLDKYEVSNRVTVHTKSIDKVGKMIDNAITAGATNVDNLNFSLSNYDSQCDDLISKASKKAYKRADSIAKSMNSTLAGISNVSTSCSSNNGSSYPRLYMAKSMVAELADEASSNASGMSISDGVIKINAHVNASFFVK